MSEKLVFQPSESISKSAHCRSMQAYKEMYRESIDNPISFWGHICQDFTWKVAPILDENFLKYNFDPRAGPINIKWMEGGVTNICYNALDKNVYENGYANKIAFYWEGNCPNDYTSITYKELLDKVKQFSNVLKSKGLKKGDCIAIYMPMILELPIAMLACSRLGIIHSIIFGGFSANSISERLLDAKCQIIITADGTWRGDKLLNLKILVNEAIELTEKKGHKIKSCIVVRHVGSAPKNLFINEIKELEGERPCSTTKLDWIENRDSWWHEEISVQKVDCEPEWMDAEDPHFILYTSGSTGKPKGVLHTIGGYMVYTATTFKYVFDHHEDDVYWCSADIGWITGHSYVCYGPLINGATSVIFEGTPAYPTISRFWQIIEKYKVSIFYTAPTAIRSLMKFGDENVTRYDRSSLRILGTVGEPINPEAWLWYHKIVGDSQCAIVDTYWQTETGGHMLTALPGAIPTKPGSATLPFFGVAPELLNDEGKIIKGPGEGYLVFKKPWPGMMRTVYKNQERFEDTYFTKFPGYYTSGDGAKRDKDGYYWITGRIDDMLNVSGHLISTAEVESAIVTLQGVAEAAVVPHPHNVKGECLYCFVTMKDGFLFTEDIIMKLKNCVRTQIGPFAQPDFIQEAPILPKTRSGKIMRRILRKIATGDRDVGDISTLYDESVIDLLLSLRPKDA